MLLLKDLKKLRDEKRDDILDFCKSTKKEIVVMPAGQKTIHFMKYLRQHNIEISYFIDNDKSKQGTFANGIKILSFDQFKKIGNNTSIIICTNSNAEKELAKQLEQNNFTDYKKTSVDYLFYKSDEVDSPEKLFKDTWKNYKKLNEILEDDFSKMTLQNRIKYLVSNNKKYIEDIAQPLENQYFESNIYKVSKEDYVIDCGAFTGDTLESCLKITNGEIAGYYAFEPDNINFEKLKNTSRKYENIELIKKGAYSKTCVLHFSGTNNSSSKIIEEGDIEISVTSIDEKLKNKKVTFVKMDIEGSEKEALIGAQNTIVEQKPVLAISVYHKFNDIYEIPFLIKSFGVSYKYYLRHYTETSGETILYAVPK